MFQWVFSGYIFKMSQDGSLYWWFMTEHERRGKNKSLAVTLELTVWRKVMLCHQISVHLLHLENNSEHDKMTLNCVAFPGEVYRQIHKITLPRQSLACSPAERALLSHVVAVGRIFDPWPSLMCSLRQEQGIVPPAPALLHIHTPRVESNKRRLREISCLTWEKQLIVWRHRQTMP